MADISICSNNECPSRVYCYRYRARVNPYRQWYSNYKHIGERCDNYWSTNGWDDRSVTPLEEIENKGGSKNE
jgi:hypothetical protein